MYIYVTYEISKQFHLSTDIFKIYKQRSNRKPDDTNKEIKRSLRNKLKIFKKKKFIIYQ